MEGHVQFAFTDEQLQFRDIAAKFMADKSPSVEVRRLMETERGFDDAVWNSLSNELGVTALIIPEVYGGQGFGFVELGIVMEEAGRALLCAPYFSTCVMGAGAIISAGTEAQKQALLPEIAAGTRFVSLALTDGAAPVRVSADGTLTGEKTLVVDGCLADTIVVAAEQDGATRLFVVDAAASGLERRHLATIDPTRKLAALSFDATPAEPMAGDAGALSDVLDGAAVALANEMMGGAQRLLDSAVEYSQIRMQFGRAIGSFQAIKHKCADLLLDVELAKSAAYQAAWARSEDEPDAPALASLAKAAASDTYMQMAAACVQLHGGIGFTWDHDTHLWYKRAKSSEVLLGDANHHRELMLQRWSET